MLFIVHAGSWLSLKLGHCTGIYNRSLCYDIRTGRTCFTTFFVNHHRPVRWDFEDASVWCKANLPGSSLVVIKSAEDQHVVERFVGNQAIEAESIITNARKLSESESRNWSWVNGQRIIPTGNNSPIISKKNFVQYLIAEVRLILLFENLDILALP